MGSHRESKSEEIRSTFGSSKDKMTDYYGEDLYDFAQNLSKADITHVDCPNNFEIPHDATTDLVNLDLTPNPRSLNNINHTKTAGEQFVSEENLQNNDYSNKDLMEILGLTDKEVEANLNPDQFHEFDQNSQKCASLEEPLDLHNDQIEYEFNDSSPGSSKDYLEFKHDATDDHASSPVPTTTLKDPASGAFYEITNTELSNFLHSRGKKRVEEPKMTQREIDQLVRRFCIPREMNFVNSDDAKRLVKSGYNIKRVEKKEMKRTADTKKTLDQFACLLCPITQGHSRKFARKEDLKRHYHQHLSFVRFHCNFANCDYKIP